MFKSLYLLTKLQLCNIFGINEARFAKDEKKRKSVKVTMFAFLIIGVMLAVYAVSLSVGLASFGYVQIVPLYLGLMATISIFAFSVFRAGALFDLKSYEKLAVLPVKQSVVVASRFLSLYVTNFLFCFVIAASGAIATVVTTSFDLWFLVSVLLSSVFMPLLPMTAALLLGTLVYAITSRFKRKNLGKTFFSLVVLIVVFILSFFTGSMGSENLDESVIGDIALTLSSIGGVLLPISWLATGTTLSGIGYYFLYVGVSLAVFATFALVLGRFYKNICSALSSQGVRGKFAMSGQRSGSALVALYKRELKRYFSSSLYFMNTFMGNVMAVFFGGVCLFGGVESLFNGVEGIPQGLIEQILPFLLAVGVGLSPMTACAISMEGKCWEMTKGLPVYGKTVMQAKLLVQFTFSVPSSILASLFAAIGLKVSGFALVWMFVLPLAFALFSGVVALFVNIKHPLFDWDNETVPVKQSTATLISMLIGMLGAILPLLAVVFLPAFLRNWGVFAVVLVFGALTWYFYGKISKVRLNEIGKK